jgi:hypothetical protein
MSLTSYSSIHPPIHPSDNHELPEGVTLAPPPPARASGLPPRPPGGKAAAGKAAGGASGGDPAVKSGRQRHNDAVRRDGKLSEVRSLPVLCLVGLLVCWSVGWLGSGSSLLTYIWVISQQGRDP